jgi:hypothetical protein
MIIMIVIIIIIIIIIIITSKIIDITLELLNNATMDIFQKIFKKQQQ